MQVDLRANFSASRACERPGSAFEGIEEKMALGVVRALVVLLFSSV
jgi:hypothetical protein